MEQKYPIETYKKLSIQVSLNGLSFSILDTVQNKILLTKTETFKHEQTPYLLQKALKELLFKHKIVGRQFSEVSVVHQSNLFTLVPKDLFDENELANYIKFNAKITANDQICFDEIVNQNLVLVYVPFNNINSLVKEYFGNYTFTHNSVVFLQTLLASKYDLTPHCFVQVAQTTMELMVVAERKLQLYNQFSFQTKEDFLYFILFVFEQLKLEPDTVQLNLFGSIDEKHELYTICKDYIKQVSLIENPSLSDEVDPLDFSLQNSL